MLKQDLSRLGVFHDLSDAQLDLILPLMTLCDYPRQYVIFNQGEPSEYLYILRSGEVVIRYKPYDGEPLTVGHILPGGVFGWSAALGRDVYTSSAVTSTNSTVYCIKGARLQQLCEQDPDTGVVILECLAGVIAERLRSTHTQIMGILSDSMDMPNLSDRRSDDGDNPQS